MLPLHDVAFNEVLGQGGCADIYQTGSSCSKLTMSLLSVLLKF